MRNWEIVSIKKTHRAQNGAMEKTKQKSKEKLWENENRPCRIIGKFRRDHELISTASLSTFAHFFSPPRGGNDAVQNHRILALDMVQVTNERRLTSSQSDRLRSWEPEPSRQPARCLVGSRFAPTVLRNHSVPPPNTVVPAQPSARRTPPAWLTRSSRWPLRQDQRRGVLSAVLAPLCLFLWQTR